MRVVSTSDLRPYGGEKTYADGGCGPWRLGKDRLLKTHVNGKSLSTEEDARGLFDIYRAAFDAGANTPEAIEVVRVGDGFGIVVSYVRGVSLWLHVRFGSISPKKAGRAVGELLRGLHEAKMSLGRDWHATFCSWSRALASLLVPSLSDCDAEKLVALVEAIPASTTLLHGDVHANNVIALRDRCSLIDLDRAGYGHPVFDLAIARSRNLLDPRDLLGRNGRDGEEDTKRVGALWSEILASYFGGVDSTVLTELDRRISVLAEIDHCCWRYRVTNVADDGLNERQRDRLARAADRLGELLPQASRLDF